MGMNIKNENREMSNEGILNEYKDRGSYHTSMDMARSWIPIYFRRFHIAEHVLSAHYSLESQVADIGGGEGILVNRLVEHGFVNVIGVDPYAPFVNEHMMRGSIFDLPFEDGKIEVLTCLDVLEHIPLHKQEEAVSELFRVLKPGGIAIISVPNMAHLRSRFNFLFKGKPWRNRLKKHPGELTMYERVEILRRGGFELADHLGLHLTLSNNPCPKVPGGKLLSKVMFSCHVPTSLCLSVVLLLCKPPRPDWVNNRPLKEAIKTYSPPPEDPTFN